MTPKSQRERKHHRPAVVAAGAMALLMTVSGLFPAGSADHGAVPGAVDEAVCDVVGVATSHPCLWYAEEFDGDALDPTRWNTLIDTQGNRVCAFDVAEHFFGVWQDVATVPCNGATQTAPFGAVTSQGATVRLSSGPSMAFPFVWSGLPTHKGPFPVRGDFSVEVRMRYTSLGPSGDGWQATVWPTHAPVGVNTFEKNILHVWADRGGLRAGADGHSVAVGGAIAWHTYRFDRVGDTYAVTIDGATRVAPFVSDRVPDTIWMGNPTFTYWVQSRPRDWSDFEVDYIRVTVPGLLEGAGV